MHDAITGSTDDFENLLSIIRHIRGNIAYEQDTDEDTRAIGNALLWRRWSPGEAKVLLDSSRLVTRSVWEEWVVGRAGRAWLEHCAGAERVPLPETEFFDDQLHAYFVSAYSREELDAWLKRLVSARGWRLVFAEGYFGGQIGCRPEGFERLVAWLEDAGPENVDSEDDGNVHQYVVGCECGVLHEDPRDCQTEGAVRVTRRTDYTTREVVVDEHSPECPLQLSAVTVEHYVYRTHVLRWRPEDQEWGWAPIRRGAEDLELPTHAEIDDDYISTEEAREVIDSFLQRNDDTEHYAIPDHEFLEHFRVQPWRELPWRGLPETGVLG